MEPSDQTASLSVPVLLLIFNRPECTRRIMEVLRTIRPPRLYVSADGPRQGKPGETEHCAEARRLATAVDWPCDMYTLFRDRNLGCGRGVSSGITWFFEQEEMGIVLEDDLVPHPTFFPYCETLLHHYRDDRRVMCISGDNFQDGRKRGDGSYYFSRLVHCWGWASWRRAWALYDFEMESFPAFEQTGAIHSLYRTRAEQAFWLRTFEGMHRSPIDTWDLQWVYAVVSNGGSCILPNVNLVSNFGFGEGATHTRHADDPSRGMPTEPMPEIVHPSLVLSDPEADYFTFRKLYVPVFPKRVLRFVRWKWHDLFGR